MIMMVAAPDKKMSHMLSHQLINPPFQELLVDLWVVQHLSSEWSIVLEGQSKLHM